MTKRFGCCSCHGKSSFLTAAALLLLLLRQTMTNHYVLDGGGVPEWSDGQIQLTRHCTLLVREKNAVVLAVVHRYRYQDRAV
jgi:hypothetical protein